MFEISSKHRPIIVGNERTAQRLSSRLYLKAKNILNRLRARSEIRSLARQGLSQRWLYCRPQGGLNDTLVQISMCLRYAAKFKRRLVVDTRRSGFLDEFNAYFTTINTFPNLILRSFTEDEARFLAGMDCLPSCLRMRGVVYDSMYMANSNYVDTVTGEPITFSFDTDHEQPLLVHEQCGGGEGGYHCLKFLRLTAETRKDVLGLIAQLPESYDAVHIRHTDVTTDYKTLLQMLTPYIRGDVLLICTDSMEVLEYSRSSLQGVKVVAIANIPDSNGQSLHHNASLTDRHINIGTIADLLAMSRAKRLFLPPPSLGYPSGYARLAVQLRSRQYLVHQLLS
jgi:hypothetical protein